MLRSLAGDELVVVAVLVLAQVDGDDAAGAVGVVLAQARLLHQTAAGGQDQEVGLVIVLKLHDLGDLLTRLEGQEVGHVLTLGVAAASGSS